MKKVILFDYLDISFRTKWGHKANYSALRATLIRFISLISPYSSFLYSHLLNFVQKSHTTCYFTRILKWKKCESEIFDWSKLYIKKCLNAQACDGTNGLHSLNIKPLLSMYSSILVTLKCTEINKSDALSRVGYQGLWRTINARIYINVSWGKLQFCYWY